MKFPDSEESIELGVGLAVSDILDSVINCGIHVMWSSNYLPVHLDGKEGRLAHKLIIQQLKQKGFKIKRIKVTADMNLPQSHKRDDPDQLLIVYKQGFNDEEMRLKVLNQLTEVTWHHVDTYSVLTKVAPQVNLLFPPQST